MRSPGVLEAVPSAGKKGFSILIFVTDLVLSPEALWSSTERLVALAVARRLGLKGDGRYRAFMKVADICRRTGLSDSTVRRALKALCESPNPLFHRRKGLKRNGHYLPIFTFTLAMRPSRFERGAHE